MLRAEALKAVTHGLAAPNRILRTLRETVCVGSSNGRAFHFLRRARSTGRAFAVLRPCVVLFLIVASGSGRALDSGQPASPYLRTVFTTEDGLPDNVVNAIVQTANGFLWLGTDGGLARFDGHRFTAVHLRGGVANESPVQSLLEAPNGDLWVGTDAGLAQLPKAALDHFDRSLVKTYHLGIGLSDQIMCIHMSRDGVLWLGTSRGLYSLNQGHFVPVIPGESISRIEGAPDGHLLIITAHGFVEWNGTRIVDHPEMARQLDVKVDGIFHVLEDSHGVRWFSTDVGRCT